MNEYKHDRVRQWTHAPSYCVHFDTAASSLHYSLNHCSESSKESVWLGRCKDISRSEMCRRAGPEVEYDTYSSQLELDILPVVRNSTYVQDFTYLAHRLISGIRFRSYTITIVYQRNSSWTTNVRTIRHPTKMTHAKVNTYIALIIKITFRKQLSAEKFPHVGRRKVDAFAAKFHQRCERNSGGIRERVWDLNLRRLGSILW